MMRMKDNYLIINTDEKVKRSDIWVRSNEWDIKKEDIWIKIKFNDAVKSVVREMSTMIWIIHLNWWACWI